MQRKSREILPSHMQLLTYLLEYTVRARIMHTFLLPLYGSIFLPSVSTLTGFSCLVLNHKSPATAKRASTYLLAKYLQHFLFRCLR